MEMSVIGICGLVGGVAGSGFQSAEQGQVMERCYQLALSSLKHQEVVYILNQE